MLSRTAELISSAAPGAIAACNVITLEYAEGIVAGAERRNSPVVLSISHNAIRFHGSIAPIAAACVAIAEAASVPVALHLDHCEDADLVLESAKHGFSSAMFDASTLPYDENVAQTATVTAKAQALGLWVEAELGEIGGKDGAHAPGVRTDPAEAAAFVEATGVDGLAVAVGTSHAMSTRSAMPDMELIAQLAASVPVPLVLHGSSGVADAQISEAVLAGIRKVNVGTHLSAAWTAGVRGKLGSKPDPRPALLDARDAIADAVATMLPAITHPA